MCNMLTHFQDPSHGWLRVSIADPLLKKIAVSRFSYTDGVYVYLEEDRDMSLYLQASEVAGVVLEIAEEYSDSDSFVRNLATFVDPKYWPPYRQLVHWRSNNA